MAATGTQPDKFLTVRVSAELHDQLVALAGQNQRTIAGEVRLALIERLQREAART